MLSNSRDANKRIGLPAPIWLPILLGIAVLLRLPGLGESFWFDEIWYSSYRMHHATAFYRALFYDVHPPLFTLVMRLWVDLFGDSEIVLRLPSLIFGLLSLFLFYRLSYRWFGERIAFWSTCLLILSPVHIWYSQEVKNNMLMLLFGLATINFLDLAWTTHRLRYWISFILCCLGSLATSRYGVWTVVVAFCWMGIQLRKPENRKQIRMPLVAAAAVALGYLPLFLKAITQMGTIPRGYLRPFDAAEIYALFLVYLPHGNTLRTFTSYTFMDQIFQQNPSLFLVDGFFAVLLGVGVFSLTIRRNGKLFSFVERGAPMTGLLLLWLSLPPVLLWIASQIYPKHYIERSAIFLLPPFVLILAIGVFSIRSARLRNSVLLALMLLNVASLSCLWIFKADSWTVYKQNPDWRSAGAYLYQIHQETGQNVVVFQMDPRDALAFYFARAKGVPLGSMKKPLGLYFLDKRKVNKRWLRALIMRYQLKDLYLIVKKASGSNFAHLQAFVSACRFLELGEKKAFRGLEIIRYRVNPRGFWQ